MAVDDDVTVTSQSSYLPVREWRSGIRRVRTAAVQRADIALNNLPVWSVLHGRRRQLIEPADVTRRRHWSINDRLIYFPTRIGIESLQVRYANRLKIKEMLADEVQHQI